MSDIPDWAGELRALIYPIQFDVEPSANVDRVVRQIVEHSVLDESPFQYYSAIEKALDSSEELSTLIPQDHSEKTIRDFLRTLKDRLAELYPVGQLNLEDVTNAERRPEPAPTDEHADLPPPPRRTSTRR